MTSRFSELRQQLLQETRQKVAASVDDDQLIIQAVTMLDLLEQSANKLAKKVREWYGLRLPELDKSVKEHPEFLARATSGSTADLLKSLGVSDERTMGGMHGKNDEKAVDEALNAVKALYDERERLLAYIEEKMQTRCPNVTILAGGKIGAQLLSHAGSLERLASVPSGTLQLYGAETALFRHLRDKRRHRSPKYGVIFNHPLVQKAKQEERGKAARALADKLSLCAKIDRFHGDLKAQEYKAALEKRFGVS